MYTTDSVPEDVAIEELTIDQLEWFIAQCEKNREGTHMLGLCKGATAPKDDDEVRYIELLQELEYKKTFATEETTVDQ